MDSQTPRPNLDADGEACLYLNTELRIWREKLFNR
jgi:hypothetical protein